MEWRRAEGGRVYSLLCPIFVLSTTSRLVLVCTGASERCNILENTVLHHCDGRIVSRPHIHCWTDTVGLARLTRSKSRKDPLTWLLGYVRTREHTTPKSENILRLVLREIELEEATGGEFC